MNPDNKLLILAGLDKKEHSPEASEVFDKLMEKIIVSTDIYQQKELLESLILLAEYYFEESQKAEKQGNIKLRKEATINRNIVRKVKKKFNTLQKKHSSARS
ncbi:MAG: hypothetical protein F6J94_26745 [Moorea sp. SIO1F2]|uniref:hypothetical protein n=1 Tax=Moorena sp. SIO1F2 TaxID=2607819 RepID=UPI0013B7B73F|nr:hypothetical protein [Moorena sp. SIO1F2]NET85370.1 hypothetical protein [Moorena sp. SIO1F2]